MSAADRHGGACLCGGVRFEAAGRLRPVIVCHCRQCRTWSGHVWAATSVPDDRFRLIRGTTLDWFASSAQASRGFCNRCGASLFWRPAGEARIAIAAGALDPPTGLAVAEHWFIGSAGDYYAPEGPPPEPAPTSGRLTCGCLCGAVAFGVPAPAGKITACHCDQCRRTSGHFSASFDIDPHTVEWLRRDGLAGYRTAGGATRHFCRRCGSSLAFTGPDGTLSVEAGAVQGPTGGRLAAHIFTAGRGDYHRIDDGLPQFPGPGPD